MEKKEQINNQPIGIWYIENNLACRINPETHMLLKLPITEEINEQINKQKTALDLVTAFEKIPNDSINLIGYLHTILKDALGYLDTQTKEKLITRITEIKDGNYLNEVNNKYLISLLKFINEKKTYLFLELFEDFENYNAANLIAPLTEKTSEHHR